MLAHRGGNWILLQNICRSLWNAITILVNTINHSPPRPHLQTVPGLSVGQVEAGGEVDVDGVSLAAVYGLACKPLYFAASALADLLLQCGTCDVQRKVEHSGTSLVDSDGT